MLLITPGMAEEVILPRGGGGGGVHSPYDWLRTRVQKK